MQSIEPYFLVQGCNFYSCSCQMKIYIDGRIKPQMVLILKFCHSYSFDWHLNCHRILQMYTNPYISSSKSMKMQEQTEKYFLSEVEYYIVSCF